MRNYSFFYRFIINVCKIIIFKCWILWFQQKFYDNLKKIYECIIETIY